MYKMCLVIVFMKYLFLCYLCSYVSIAYAEPDNVTATTLVDNPENMVTAVPEQPLPEPENVIAARRALQWLNTQNNADGWGKETPRVVIAKALSNIAIPGTEDVEILRKQLNIHVTLQLMKNDFQEPLSRLALLVNALLSTCQNPKNFQGRDLVEELYVKAKQQDQKRRLPPIIYLSLCLGGKPDTRISESAYGIISGNYGTDMKVLSLMAIACRLSSADDKHKEHLNRVLEAALEGYTFTNDTVDVYTIALVVQAINLGSSFLYLKDHLQHKDLAQKALLSAQLPDGSFGDVLSTYYALPALLGLSLLDIKHMSCISYFDDAEVHEAMYEPTAKNEVANVHYSLWIGEEPGAQVYSLSLDVGANWTFFDVMLLAESKGHQFRFRYEPSELGRIVYSIGGIPNDSEKRLHWILYIDNPNNPDIKYPKSGLVRYNRGVDTIKIVDNGRYVFSFETLTE